MDKFKLRRCPKCGGKATFELYSEGVYVAGCSKNFCMSLPFCGSDKQGATDAWNAWAKKNMKRKTYRVEIVEISTGKVVSIVGRCLTESQAERRLITAISRINTDKFFARDVEEK